MNVAFLFLHPFAGSLGSTTRVRELTIHLSNLGVDCSILTPYESDHAIQKGLNIVSIGGLFQKVGLGKYLYEFTKTSYYNPLFIKYFLTNINLQALYAKINARSVLTAFKKGTPQILIAEQDFALPTAVQVKKQTGLPLIVDLHNITSEELVACGSIKRNSAEFLKLQEILKINLAYANEVAVVSDLMKDYVHTNFGVPSAHVHVIPPGCNPSSVSSHIVKRASNPPKVVYSGLVAYREHVDLFVKSMPIVQEAIKNVKFFITNKGENLKAIKNLANNLGVKPTFFWYPNENDFLEFLSSCDIAVLPSTTDLARQMGTPVKLFDYLSAGLPIVANNIGAWSELIQSEGFGIITDDDPHSFATAIIKLIKNQEFRTQCTNNAMRMTRSWTWVNSARKLKALLENCALS